MGDTKAHTSGFEWIDVYSELAGKIRENHGLVKTIFEALSGNVQAFVKEHNDPFSFFAAFNYQDVDDDYRRFFLRSAIEKCELSCDIPNSSFLGIPAVQPRSNPFDPTKKSDGYVQCLWDFFDAAIDYANNPNEDNRQIFFDSINTDYLSFNSTLTAVLFQMRPDFYLPLDNNTRAYLKGKIEMNADFSNGRGEPSIGAILKREGASNPTAKQYVAIIETVSKSEEIKKDYGDELPKGELFAQISHKAWKVSSFAQTFALLESNYQVVLTGAPGTGKTYTAKEVASEFTGDKWIVKTDLDGVKKGEWELGRISSVQFHPGYDYADFVVGMKPVLVSKDGLRVFRDKDGLFTRKEDKDDGTIQRLSDTDKTAVAVSFRWQDGIFKKFADKARRAYDEAENKEDAPKFVFIIDEINRADLSRVFGEIFSLLEEDYRYPNGKGTDSILLPNGEWFSIPKNLYIIGTMNDIDRSVESMDFALRRRFAWYEVTAESSQGIIDEKVEGGDAAKKLKAAMRALNEIIASPDMRLGTEYQLGGAIFAKHSKYKGTKGAFEQLWDNHIKIILREYLRDKRDRVNMLFDLEEAYRKKCELPSNKKGVSQG